MQSRIGTRLVAALFLSVFVFGMWSCRHSQDFSIAARRVLDIHDKGFYNSQIMYVYPDEKLVQVLTLEGERKDILFEVEDEFLDFLSLPGGKFRIGSILPVTFICGKRPGEDCNPSKSYALYIATRKVKPVIVQKNKNGG